MLGLALLLISIFQFSSKRYFLSLVLFFLFCTNGFQFIPVSLLMNGLPLDKGTDLALFYILWITISQFAKISFILKKYKIFKLYLFLIVFTTISAFFSVFVLEYPIANVVQVYRQYLIFLSFILFFVTPLRILKRVFHFIAIITVLQSFLFLMQIWTGHILLLASDGSENVNTTLSGAFIRYYNSPAFLIPTLFYFLFVYNFKKPIYFYLVISLLFLTILGPLHRSGIIATIAAITVYTLLKKGNSIYLAGVGILLVLISFVDVVNKRMSETYLDITSTFGSNLNLQNLNQDDNTLIFRIAHFSERFVYVLKQPFGWLFGIGLISDNSPLAYKLPFNNGIVSEVTGEVVKIDTGDLIYSPLFLTLGILGTILYLFVFIKFLIFFYKNFKSSTFAIIGFLTILNGFFISLTSTEMLSSTFRVIIILLSVIVCKQIIITKKYIYE